MVSKWFNRGQPVVGRQTRSALEELGHETFVLARPKKERGPRPSTRPRRRLGSARRHRGVRLRHSRRRVRTLGLGERHRGDLLRPELPIRRAGGAARPRCAYDRALRLGALQRRPRRRRQAIRPRLLADPRRAGPLRRDGHRVAVRALGLSPPSSWPSPRTAPRAEHPNTVTYVFPGASSATASRSSRCWTRSWRRPTAPAPGGQGPGRARAGAACRGGGRARSADPAHGRRSADAGTSARWRRATSVSPARWEGLGLPSTRRSPSGCRRSRTMRRR